MTQQSQVFQFQGCVFILQYFPSDNWILMNTSTSPLPHNKSAFHPLLPTNLFLTELETLSQQLIAEKKKIELTENADHSGTSHPLTHILVDMLASLNEVLVKEGTNAHLPNFYSISFKLLSNLAVMVDNQLFLTQSKYYRELITAILFSDSFSQIFKRFFGHSNHNATVMSLFQFDQMLVEMHRSPYEQNHCCNLYSMYGGSFIALEQQTFEQSLYYIIWNLGRFFTSKNNFITRNIKNMKKSHKVNEILNSSVKLICNYQNKVYIDAEIKKISDSIFTSPVLLKQQFLEKVQALQKSDPVSHILWAFFDLVRAQSMILLQTGVKDRINTQKQVDRSNYYEIEMQKLFKKCPYNGDECCQCKKCQCVRRNRQSAKVSQEKKRNAVEQLDPLKRRIEELEKKNKQLEEENSILKGIFDQIKNCPGLREALSSTLEPINKVLDN